MYKIKVGGSTAPMAPEIYKKQKNNKKLNY